MGGFFRRNGPVWVAALVGLAVVASAARPCLAAEPALAIDGYDPVAYFTQGRATKGDPAYEHTWDEARYRFASAEHRKLFKADPAHYAPQFPGLCAVSLANGVKVEPNPEYWLIGDGMLYLFGKSIGPEKFKSNFAGNVARANENWRRVQRGEALPAGDEAK